MTIKYPSHIALAVVFCLSLSACSGGGGNSRIDYDATDSTASLEVPPDLSVPVDTGVDKIPTINGSGGGGSSVLPHYEDIRIARDGSTRWLVIESDVSKLWPRLKFFWESVGLEVELDQPSLGIMETGWAASRTEVPKNILAKLLNAMINSAYSTGLLDKYRLRLERVDDERTELYITHYGLKEVVASENNGVVDTAWEVRPSDPELANEILNRLVIYLGGSEQTAEAVLDSKPVESSSRARILGKELILEEGFSRGWRLTGVALERIGLAVEDRNRSEGIYYVSHVDQLEDAGVREKNWINSLFSSDEQKEKSKQWQVQLSGDDSTTYIRLRNEQGGAAPEDLNRSILEKLQEALR
ncbi:MAG: outer membrane protein assembly factor BamC [Pseudomonadota bacterium]